MSERRAKSEDYCPQCDKPIMLRGECVICDDDDIDQPIHNE